MPASTWTTQIYEMTDEDTQAEAVELLAITTPQLTVEARTSEPRGWHIAVECPDSAMALTIYEMVMMVDSHAELVHPTAGPALQVETD